MLPSIGSLIVKSFHVYFSTLKKFVPYLFLFLFFSILLSFANTSKPLLSSLISSVYVKAIIYLFSSIFFSLLGFILSLSFIKVVGLHYIGQPVPKFWSNIKESFFLTFKNLATFVFLAIPAIILYVFYLFSIMGYVNFVVIFIGLWLIILLGVLVYIWFSFVLVDLALEKGNGLSSIVSSVKIVKGRVGSVFIRLFLPSFVLYIIFAVMNGLFDMLFGSTIFYTVVMLLLTLAIIPFSVVVPTILYCDLMKKPVLDLPKPESV
ncbi:MAG: hypothetical protein PHQ18_00945 [Patescibacteria group bacterium]|nr:hypothetical protein [Patescibacteria group bacterium]